MQERYLGDIHDYFKFLFIKHISKELNSKIGLNWFLVNPNQIGSKELKKNDGEKRNYLNDKTLISYDKKLIEELKFYLDKSNRKINTFTDKTHLSKYIRFFNKHIDLNNREAWIQESLEYFKNEKVIFLDPDNGFSCKKKGKANLKYLFPNDCKALLSSGKIIIFSQFQSFSIKNTSHLKNIFEELSKNKINTSFPIIRNRTGPNTFFITLLPKNNSIDLRSIYKNYEQMNYKVELIEIL